MSKVFTSVSNNVNVLQKRYKNEEAERNYRLYLDKKSGKYSNMMLQMKYAVNGKPISAQRIYAIVRQIEKKEKIRTLKERYAKD